MMDTAVFIALLSLAMGMGLSGIFKLALTRDRLREKWPVLAGFSNSAILWISLTEVTVAVLIAVLVVTSGPAWALAAAVLVCCAICMAAVALHVSKRDVKGAFPAATLGALGLFVFVGYALKLT